MEKTLQNCTIIPALNLHKAKKFVLKETGIGFRLPAFGFKRYYTDSTPLAVCIIRTPRFVVYANRITNMGFPLYEITFEPTKFSRFLESKDANLKTIDEEIECMVNRLAETQGY